MRVILRNLSFSCICVCGVVAKGSPHNETVKNASMVTPNLIVSFKRTTAGCVAVMAARIVIVSWEGEVGG